MEKTKIKKLIKKAEEIEEEVDKRGLENVNGYTELDTVWWYFKGFWLEKDIFLMFEENQRNIIQFYEDERGYKTYRNLAEWSFWCVDGEEYRKWEIF